MLDQRNRLLNLGIASCTFSSSQHDQTQALVHAKAASGGPISWDTAGAARLLTIFGNGYDEFRRFAEAHWFFGSAIWMMRAKPAAGFPFSPEVGDANALAGEGRRGESINELKKVVSEARTVRLVPHFKMLTIGDVDYRAEYLSGEGTKFELEIKGFGKRGCRPRDW